MQSTNVLIFSSADPSVSGQPVTLTAAIAPAASGTAYPTGTVTFVVDCKLQIPVTIANGLANLSLPSLAIGPHSVAAAYSGDSNFDPGISPDFAQVVVAALSPQVCPAGAIDVTLHGVIGDGVTDNQAALQTLIGQIGPAVASRANPSAPSVFYFPAGTYLVSGTVDFSAMQAVGILGDVDVAGQPASIIKGTAASGNLVRVGSGHSSNFHVWHMQFLGTAGQTGFYSYVSYTSSFDNCIFSGHIGLDTYATFSGAVRSCKFLGAGAANTGSVGYMMEFPTGNLISDCDFSGWDEGIRINGVGQSVVRSTFEKCGIGARLGADKNGLNAGFSRSTFSDVTFADNDVGIFFQTASSCFFSDINVVGTAAAPSGQSKYGLVGASAVTFCTFSNVNASGGFVDAAIGICPSYLNKYTVWRNTTFYSSTATNSVSTGKGWDIRPDALSAAVIALGRVQVNVTDATLPNLPANIDDVTACNVVASPLSIVDVTQHGIVGDGRTDNTVKLQGLISVAQPGTTFYFPTGTYNVSGTIDYSGLPIFSLVGDMATSGGIAGATTIRGNVPGPILKADYGAAAGTFQIRNLVITNGSQAVGSSGLFTRNSVLSSIKDVSITGHVAMDHENSFMLSMRGISALGSGVGNIGVMVNGGLRSTLDVVSVTGWLADGVRVGGHKDFALLGADIEVNGIGVNVGLDCNGNASTAIGLSLQGLGLEANGFGLDLKNCSRGFIAGSGSQGHTNTATPNLIDNTGILFEDGAHDCTFAAFQIGGYYVAGPAIHVTSGAAFLLLTDGVAANGPLTGLTNKSVWDIESTNNIVLNSCT